MDSPPLHLRSMPMRGPLLTADAQWYILWSPKLGLALTHDEVKLLKPGGEGWQLRLMASSS